MDPYFLELNAQTTSFLPWFAFGAALMGCYLFSEARKFVNGNNEKGLKCFIVFLPSLSSIIVAGYIVFNITFNPIFANAASDYGCYKYNEKRTTLITHNLDDIRLREWINDTADNLNQFKKEVDPKVDVDSVAFKSSLQDYTVTMEEMLEFFLWVRFEEPQVKA